MHTRSEITDVNTALAAIKKYGKVKDGLLVRRNTITEEAFLSKETVEGAQAVSREIGERLQTLARLQNEESRLLARQASLEPWRSLDMPLNAEGTAHVFFRMGVCPGGADTGAIRTELAAAGVPAELLEISADRQQRYLLLICHRAEEEQAMEVLRPRSFSAVTFQGICCTAAEELDRLATELAENRRGQEAAAAAITDQAPSKESLQVYADRLAAEAARETNAERLLTDGTILFFEGWAPAEQMDKVQALLEKTGCAWEAQDPAQEEIPQVPVELKNNWFTRPLNMVTEMYALPSYDGVDPNPLMAPFFIFFYGFMMADMGYGLLMMLAAFISWPPSLS